VDERHAITRGAHLYLGPSSIIGATLASTHLQDGLLCAWGDDEGFWNKIGGQGGSNLDFVRHGKRLRKVYRLTIRDRNERIDVRSGCARISHNNHVDVNK